MQFPTNPISGQEFSSSTGIEYIWNDTKRIWEKKVPVPDLTVDDTNTTIKVKKIWTGTRSEYDAISPKLDDVLYFVKD